jgi:hypothetical protein
MWDRFPTLMALVLAISLALLSSSPAFGDGPADSKSSFKCVLSVVALLFPQLDTITEEEVETLYSQGIEAATHLLTARGVEPDSASAVLELLELLENKNIALSFAIRNKNRVRTAFPVPASVIKARVSESLASILNKVRQENDKQKILEELRFLTAGREWLLEAIGQIPALYAKYRKRPVMAQRLVWVSGYLLPFFARSAGEPQEVGTELAAKFARFALDVALDHEATDTVRIEAAHAFNAILVGSLDRHTGDTREKLHRIALDTDLSSLPAEVALALGAGPVICMGSAEIDDWLARAAANTVDQQLLKTAIEEVAFVDYETHSAAGSQPKVLEQARYSFRVALASRPLPPKLVGVYESVTDYMRDRGLFGGFDFEFIPVNAIPTVTGVVRPEPR